MSLKDWVGFGAFSLFLFMMSVAKAGSPLWTFQPLPNTKTTLTVPANSTALVQYRVTNQSDRPHTLVMQKISGITQITTGLEICGNSFVLQGHSSCILSLQINGSQLNYPINDGPYVCQQGSRICYRPSVPDILHITQAPPTTNATISVTGSPLTLSTNGGNRQLIIRNLSSELAATNITSNFSGTALNGNVTETGNTCAYVPPGGNCTLTYTPGNTVVPQTNFIIQGSNTNALVAAITIQSGSAVISVAGSPLTLAVNGATGQLIITNTSTEMTATNVTSNFNGTALDGNVTETGNNCASISPGGSCILTYTPGSTAVPQTNFTIQGTNTNALVAAIAIQSGSTLTAVSPTSGVAAGGVGVTLTGTALTGATAVRFGGVSATSVNVVNSTTVTAVTPAHTIGVVDVVIDTPAGGATLANGFTYVTTAVGLSSNGGIIACLNGGFNNLIAATTNISSGIQWGGMGILVPGAGSTTNGATNTTDIVNELTGNQGIPLANYAAGLCSDYAIDSQGNSPCLPNNTCYNDWFLPAGNNISASGQLNCLYVNRVAIGGFPAVSNYWSSTQDYSGIPSDFVWTQNFFSSFQGPGNKDGFRYVRCVRNFTP
ncbi:IPT/TIG domain-containing protein [Legionella cardiaca]|uniref:IPT/TIG domain-containing protein n=1 Tax=Legionella cardiaca TaxID=1071983 RepID=A0ABY8AWY3_9GAMM|nr:IPT/TIG domain-containing protein [Legionella cardiaca]WED43941.1 IPT/TIG domain-containing protein [Legionella cardiaca]